MSTSSGSDSSIRDSALISSEPGGGNLEREDAVYLSAAASPPSSSSSAPEGTAERVNDDHGNPATSGGACALKTLREEDEEDDLPTYDRSRENAEREEGGMTPSSDLGHNSARFGRWRDWIEKRAGERYLDEQQAQEDEAKSQRRRSRQGWGEGRYGPRSDSDPLLPAEIEATHFPASSSSHHEATDSTSTSSVHGHLSHNSSAAAFHLRSTAPPAQPPVTLEASPLTYHSLGSRFLPHLPSIPLCALPILAGRFLLLGTANGLYALDPSRLDRDEGGARCIWEGLGVQEMKEVGVEKDDQGGTKTPQAAVVMLTCPAKNDDDGGGEIVGNVEGGEVRVWQAASLVSLACWVLDIKDAPEPLNLSESHLSSTPSTGGGSFRSQLHAGRASFQGHRHLSTLSAGVRTLLSNAKLQQTPSASSGSSFPYLSTPTTGDDGHEDDSYFVPVSESDETDPARTYALRWSRDYLVLPLPTSSGGGALALEVYRPDKREWAAEARAEIQKRAEDGDVREAEDEERTRRGVWGGRVLLGVAMRKCVMVFESKDGRGGQFGFYKEFSLPSGSKPLSSISFIHVHALSIAPSRPRDATTAPGPQPEDLYAHVFNPAPPPKGSLSLMLGLASERACLIQLESCKVLELEWPSSATDEQGWSRPSSSEEERQQAAPTIGGLDTELPDRKGKASSRLLLAHASGGGKIRSLLPGNKGAAGDGCANGSGSITPGGGTSTCGGGSKWGGKPVEIWVPIPLEAGLQPSHQSDRATTSGRTFIALTQGNRTGIWEAPLPVPLPPPLHQTTWDNPPTSVTYMISPSTLSSSGSIAPTARTLTLLATTCPILTLATLEIQTLPIRALLSTRRNAAGVPQPPPEGSTLSHQLPRKLLLGEMFGLFEPAGERGRDEERGGGGWLWGWDWRKGDDGRVFGLEANEPAEEEERRGTYSAIQRIQLRDD